jgi:DNA topoisomerase-3
VIWKAKAGKTLTVPIARELIKTGYTEKPVTGFRGRSGRSFRAHLAMQQTDEGKWRVEFDEEWAKEGAKAPEAEVQDDELTVAKSKAKAKKKKAASIQRSAA